MSAAGEINRPQRLFYYLAALSALSREYGLVIGGDPKLEWRDGAQGDYLLNPNNEGPEFGWLEKTAKDRLDRQPRQLRLR